MSLVDTGKSFWSNSSGKWAGEQMVRAMAEGRPLNADVLRTADTLRRDEWIAYDDTLVEEATIRLRGVADLLAAGLVRNVANGMGKTVYQWEKVTDMEPAIVSLDGMVQSDNDRVEFDFDGLPLPITHKDFFLNLRTLSASRERGESLDTTQARIAGRLVAEKTEDMLFNGASKVYAGLPIYGYTTHPNRNTIVHGTNGLWTAAAKTGDNILSDVIAMKALADAQRQYGPYVLYVSASTNLALDKDFKANSDWTIRQRLLMVDGITAIRISDKLAAGNEVLVQMTPETVVMVQGERLQTIQWDTHGGFGINFKAFQIMVPLVRADIQNRSGIVHMAG
jgi:hypothetical protein